MSSSLTAQVFCDQALGRATTGANGPFTVTYGEANPDVVHEYGRPLSYARWAEAFGGVRW